jgi:hypothetical protein
MSGHFENDRYDVLMSVLRINRRIYSTTTKISRDLSVSVVHGLDQFASDEDVVVTCLDSIRARILVGNLNGHGHDPEGLPWLNVEHTEVGIRPFEEELARVLPNLEPKLLSLPTQSDWDDGYIAIPFLRWITFRLPHVNLEPRYEGKWRTI